MSIIIGIIDGHYSVQTPEGLKKNVRDEIKIENYSFDTMVF